MPTLENYSLLDVRGRFPSPYLHPRGNWKDTDFLAPYVQNVEGQITAWGFQIDVSTVVRTVVFVNDAVIYAQMMTRYGTSDTPFAATLSDFTEDPVYEHGDTAGNLVLNTNSTLAPGEALTGPTFTAGVPVTGYLLRTTLKDRLITLAAGRVDPLGFLMIRSRSATMDGQVQNLAATTVIPIILWEPHYTQAIFNNNNRLTLAGVDYVVLGIFSQLLA